MKLGRETASIILAFVMSVTLPSASRAQSGDWQPLRMDYRSSGGQPADPADAAWAREIAADAKASTVGLRRGLPVYSVRFADGARVLVVTAALQGPDACDYGPNSSSSTRDYAVCPGKLAVLEGGRLVSSRPVGMVCLESVNAGGEKRGNPTWKDPARWGTRARLDGGTGTIQMVTMQNGRAERACNQSIAVR